MTDAISIKNIGKRFLAHWALREINLNLPSLGIVGVIGPNGSGKSTLINIVSGFLRPDAGHCVIGGRDMTGWPPYRIARYGVVRTFQEVRLVDTTVREHLMLATTPGTQEYPRRVIKRDDQLDVESVLDRFGLADVADAHAATLSYGQRKLLSLACADATRATTLLLDEPLASTDYQVRQRIADFFIASRQERLIVFVEHDLAAVRQIADVVVLLVGGRVRAIGSSDEVFAHDSLLESFVGD